MKSITRYLATAALAVLASCQPAFAAEPADNGVWSSPQTDFQGFAVQFAPVDPPAVVFYWFTYDQDGNQAWFISDNVPVNSGRSEDIASIYRPVCAFADSPEDPASGEPVCARGDPVGVLAIGRSGDRLSVRFGISTALEGFGENCAQHITPPVRPSPLPPDIPAEYGCQSELVLSRVTPAIAALER